MKYIKNRNNDIYGYTDSNKIKKHRVLISYFNIGLSIRRGNFIYADYIYMNNDSVYYTYINVYKGLSTNETGLHL